MRALKSKRFWSALLAIGAIIAVQRFGADQAQVNVVIEAIKDIVSILIGAYGAQDIVATFKDTKEQ